MHLDSPLKTGLLGSGAGGKQAKSVKLDKCFFDGGTLAAVGSLLCHIISRTSLG